LHSPHPGLRPRVLPGLRPPRSGLGSFLFSQSLRRLTMIRYIAPFAFQQSHNIHSGSTTSQSPYPGLLCKINHVIHTVTGYTEKSDEDPGRFAAAEGRGAPLAEGLGADMAPSVIPRIRIARKRKDVISCTFRTSWEAASSRTQKNIMNLLYFLGGHVISMHAKEYHEHSVLPGIPCHLLARKINDDISCIFSTSWDSVSSSRTLKKG
jgi:hypothetical protein